MHDVVIIGAGPAGLSAAFWCDELGLDTLILEQDETVGGQLPKIYNPIEDYLGLRADNGADLFTFAAITDEPPPEIAAAGHDRCIVPIKPEHLDAWLNPDKNNLAAQFAILDDRARPYYEHRLAA